MIEEYMTVGLFVLITAIAGWVVASSFRVRRTHHHWTDFQGRRRCERFVFASTRCKRVTALVGRRG